MRAPETRIQVNRDNTFHRAVADDVAIASLGRDLELCFLQFGGVLHAKRETDEHIEMEYDQSVTEVVRVRMGFPEAVKLAMQIVQNGVISGRIKPDGVIKSVQEWRQGDAHEEEGTSSDEPR